MIRASSAALAAGAIALLAACGARAPEPSADSGFARAVPADASLVAAADLTRLRATPLYAHLPAGVLAWSQPDRQPSAMLFALRGDEMLVLLRGDFTAASVPAGAVLVARGLAAGGSAALASGAAAQFRAGNRAVSPLLDYAAGRSSGADLWVAARGGVALPLPGNYANLNRLLRDVEYAVLAARVGAARCEIRLDARGLNDAAARHFEETLRAMLALAGVAEGRHADFAALLQSAAVRREGVDVTVTLDAPPDQAAALLDRLGR